MLDFIYYPISAILWFWHQFFGFLLGPASGMGWALSVVFLVFTLRAATHNLLVRQMRNQRVLQQLQPEIQLLRKKHSADRRAFAAAQLELQARHGVSTFGSLLPTLLQTPVILGLYHVLRSFNRIGAPLHLSAFVNANTANYVFGTGDVQSFLDAKLFGAPLASAITSPLAQLSAYTGQVARWDIVVVAIPLMLIAAVATHFTARASTARQAATTTGEVSVGAGLFADPHQQAAVVKRLVLWFFPLGALVFGVFLPVALLLYWVANNAWTLAQQHYVHRKLDRHPLRR